MPSEPGRELFCSLERRRAEHSLFGPFDTDDADEENVFVTSSEVHDVAEDSPPSGRKNSPREEEAGTEDEKYARRLIRKFSEEIISVNLDDEEVPRPLQAASARS